MSNNSNTSLSDMHKNLESLDLLVKLLRGGFLASEGVPVQKDGVQIQLGNFEYIPAELWLTGKVDLEVEQVATRDGSTVYQKVRISRNPLSSNIPATKNSRFQYLYIDEALAEIQSLPALLRALAEGYPKAYGIDGRSIDSPLGARHELVPDEALQSGQIDFMTRIVTYVPLSDFRRQPVTFHDVRVNRHDFEEVFRPSPETKKTKKATTERNYPWDEFWIEAFAIVEEEGWPKSKKEFARRMAVWCSAQWTDPPDIRTIERELAKIYERLNKQ